MAKTSAGILPYRHRGGRVEVLLVHPGGPFWARKNLGAWSITKGECEAGENPLQTAIRECGEETGYYPPGPFMSLSPRKQPSGKLVLAWASAGDWDPAQLVSNSFSLEWPKGSGVLQAFPEVDRAEWFDLAAAAQHILPGQRGFLDELQEKLSGLSP